MQRKSTSWGAHAAAPSETELGAFLREEGLHRANLDAWRVDWRKFLRESQ